MMANILLCFLCLLLFNRVMVKRAAPLVRGRTPPLLPCPAGGWNGSGRQYSAGGDLASADNSYGAGNAGCRVSARDDPPLPPRPALRLRGVCRSGDRRLRGITKRAETPGGC